MSFFYFHLRDGVDILLDLEGRELDSSFAIEEAALREARSIISEDARKGRIDLDVRIDVEDELRNVVHSLCFRDAVEILPPTTATSARRGGRDRPEPIHRQD
jgi:hypothetical protein